MTGARDLRALPKAHLHIHLEGAMRRETLEELCQRYDVPVPPDTRGQRFDNFDGFVETYFAACRCLVTRDDLARLVREVAEDAAAHGAWWIEPAFDAERFMVPGPDRRPPLFASQEEGWEFALEAAQAAGCATGVGIGYLSAVDRSQPVEQALERARITAELVKRDRHGIESGMASLTGRHAGIVAFGLHGNEEGFPPEPFAEAFRIALDDTGLLSAPHAGEIAPWPDGGPASVRDALDHLGADRIMHGVLAIEDEALLNRLGEAGVCLDVCPSSNLLLNVFPDVAAHALPRLLELGIPCDLGSDDPLLFGPDLVDEFTLAREEMGLDDHALADLARSSFEYSGAPSEVKAAGLAAIGDWLGG